MEDRNLGGRPSKALTEADIRRAMKASSSNRAAARVLNVSEPTYKLYATMYVDQETGKTLFELHKNSAGKGIRKFTKDSREPVLTELLKEGMSVTSYSIDKLKGRLLKEGVIKSECSSCQFCEERITDKKIPLLLNFRDGNKSNWTLENIEMLCYNCYFLFVGDLFSKKEIEKLEDFGAPTVEKAELKWEMDERYDDYFDKFLGNLGGEEDEEEPGSEYISKI